MHRLPSSVRASAVRRIMSLAVAAATGFAAGPSGGTQAAIRGPAPEGANREP